ncbi:LOW QUALITY PROTEIN: plasmolipin [Geothlypis trichas]
MAGLPGAARARSASPGSPPALDGSFLLSPLGGLMCARPFPISPQVLGLLVWSLIAATTYHLHAAYGWVMFVSLFFWILTILFLVTYLLQLHQKFYMVPWPPPAICNAVATVAVTSRLVTCAAAVQPTSWRQWELQPASAASFFACVTMITYGVSTFFSFRAWKEGSNAATSQCERPRVRSGQQSPATLGPPCPGLRQDWSLVCLQGSFWEQPVLAALADVGAALWFLRMLPADVPTASPRGHGLAGAAAPAHPRGSSGSTPEQLHSGGSASLAQCSTKLTNPSQAPLSAHSQLQCK